MESVVFFDGVCNLCNHAVDFIVTRDRYRNFRYGSLQSPQAQYLLARHQFKIGKMDTLVLLKNNRLFLRSDAVLEICRDLPWPWSWAVVFKIIPRGFRDMVYRWVSRNRYRWFGKRETCRVPTPEERSLFLESAPAQSV